MSTGTSANNGLLPMPPNSISATVVSKYPVRSIASKNPFSKGSTFRGDNLPATSCLPVLQPWYFETILVRLAAKKGEALRKVWYPKLPVMLLSAEAILRTVIFPLIPRISLYQKPLASVTALVAAISYSRVLITPSGANTSLANLAGVPALGGGLFSIR